ncbi:hypothetical protein PTI98_007690 [Pleurotus ostreatus]|nr:hypothetical protein PTI98_007690 [Pleurotus ostreatus]
MLKVIKASEIKLAESWAYRGTLLCCLPFGKGRQIRRGPVLAGGFKDSTHN